MVAKKSAIKRPKRSNKTSDKRSSSRLNGGNGGRGARWKSAEGRSWIPEVSPTGELLLRRRQASEQTELRDTNYPFSQGLTFVARRWRNLMNEELRAVGQSQARWGTLYWIAVFGDTVNQTELADRIGVEQPTLGRVLRDLEAEGLVERSVGSRDKRAKVILLTAAAKPLLREINRIATGVSARLLRDIDPRELAVCTSVFAKILQNMDRATAAPRKRR